MQSLSYNKQNTKPSIFFKYTHSQVYKTIAHKYVVSFNYLKRFVRKCKHLIGLKSNLFSCIYPLTRLLLCTAAYCTRCAWMDLEHCHILALNNLNTYLNLYALTLCCRIEECNNIALPFKYTKLKYRI